MPITQHKDLTNSSVLKYNRNKKNKLSLNSSLNVIRDHNESFRVSDRKLTQKFFNFELIIWFRRVLHVLSSALILVCVESQRRKLQCIPDNSDNTTCTFVDISSSFDLDVLFLFYWQNFSSVKRVNFVDCYLEHVPNDLINIYPEVEIIDVSASNLIVFDLFHQKLNKIQVFNASNNHLVSVESEWILKSKSLESLDISHNYISRINPYTFVFNENFKHLNLSYNKISRVDFKVLNPLRCLEVLRLNNNQIKEISGDFKDFNPNWKELYLQNNMLKTLDISLVKSVSILDLSENQLTEAKFHDLKLTELLISKNNLKLLTFDGNLEKLNCARNREKDFNFDLKNSKKLKYLDLSGSKFISTKKLLALILTLKQLSYLNLGETKFNFKENMFKELSNLEHLNIENCMMMKSKFFNNTFNHMTKLKELDLSHNRFTELDLTSLGKLKDLERIDFRQNFALKFIGWRNISDYLPHIKKIGLYDNSFGCNETQAIIDEFRKKGIEIEHLEEYGDEYFLDRCSYDDLNLMSMSAEKPYDLDNEPDKLNNRSYIAWVAPIFVISFIIVGLELARRRFNISSRVSRTQDHSEVLIGNKI